MGLRAQGCALAVAVALTGCGDQFSADQNRSQDECNASRVQNRYVASLKDGGIEVVRATSEEALANGYLKRNHDRVAYAEPDYWVRVENHANLFVSRVTSYADNWGPARIGADHLWGQGVRGAGVMVAVIDTGLDVRHPQLSTRVVSNGFDYVRSKPLSGDHGYHGTHVAGIIAAAHQDVVARPTRHVEGVAPDAQILPLAFLDEQEQGLMSNAAQALHYAVQRGARVVNASWGGSRCSRTLKDAIAGLSNKGVVFVTAAGNKTQDIDRFADYPATLNLPAMLTVGATDMSDQMAYFSNYGRRTTHLFAPGQDVISTLPDGQVGALSGTSMATPFVSGAVALLMSAEPTATVPQLRQALYDSAFKDPSFANFTQGRLDLRDALERLRSAMGR